MLGSAPAPAGGLADRVAAAARFFKPRTSRWSFWLCEDHLDAHELRRARGMLADFGLRAISHPPGMFAAELAPVRGLLPPLQIERVDSASHQRAFAEITALSFEIPYSIAAAVYAHPHAWNGEYRGVVGVAEGRVVAIAATVETRDAMGVYSLATHPAYRRRGYGEALLRAAVAGAQRCTGPRGIVLQSTEA